VLLAVTLTAVGFAYDAGSGDKELSMVFAASYALGCIFAVLAVRKSGIFTAVIQPPLILFVAVPTAYFLFHGATITGIKDTLINFGYPLIQRFPLMFFTSAAVLLIGMGRWYYGMSSRRGAAHSSATEKTSGSRVSSVTSKMSSLLTSGDVESVQDTVDATESSRTHTIDRPSRPAKATKAAKPAAGTARSGRTTKRASPSRSRHARPPETELIEPVTERPRRPRTPRQSEQPPVPPAEPRRRSRSSTREPRKATPPADRRASYERPERPGRRRRRDDYQPREPHGNNGNGTHHPVSRVRYRGDADENDRAEHRTQQRTSRSAWEADSWEYDI
jgi:hypothetical protein